MGIQERKEREKEQRREAILDAAEDVFSRKGLQSSTMDEIAERAELSKPTLYLYFGSKEDLYQAVANRGLDILEQVFRSVTEKGLSALQTLVRLGEAQEAFFRKHRGVFRLFSLAQSTSYCGQISDEALKAHHAGIIRIKELAVGILQKGIAEGIVRPELDPAEVSVILWSSGHMLLQWLDTDMTVWNRAMGVDLTHTLRLSHRLLLEAILTDTGRRSLQLLSRTS